VKLWTFVGETSEWTVAVRALWLGNTDLYFEGAQQEDSLYFVELLQYFTGKPLSRYG